MLLRFAFFAVVCGHLGGSAVAQERQLGAYDVPVEMFPFVVAIRWGSQHAGNGAILAPKWIISTTNVLSAYPQSAYTASAGGNTVSGGERYVCERIFLHEKSMGFHYDIALMKVNRKIKFSDRVQPIKLIDVNPDSFAGLMLSYGKNEIGTSHLRGAACAMASDNVCVNKIEEPYAKEVIKNRHGYCVYPFPEDVQQGQWYNDGGAPIIHWRGNRDYRLVAIWAYGSTSKYEVYNTVSIATRLGSFRDWIDATMKLGADFTMH